jgi:biotin carboxylase
MNVVLLSPHFPSHQYRYAEALQHHGVTVIGLADEPIPYLTAQQQHALSDYQYVSSMHSHDALTRACGQITADHGKIDRIESLNEYWLETEARLRTDFNVPGVQVSGIEQIKAKSAMKACFQAEGIPCARGRVVTLFSEAEAFAAEVGYPLVLKPNVGVGASHTYRIDDAEALHSIWHENADHENILEEYIAGKICSYDGLTDREGNIVWQGSMIYSNGVMEVVNHDLHVYYYTLRQIPAELERMGRQLVKAYDVRERFFHFEFFQSPENDEYIALEVNMRPAGGPSLDMYNFSSNIDLYQEWGNVVATNTFTSPEAEALYHCAYVGRKHNKDYALSHHEVMHYFGEHIVHVAEHPPLFRRAMGDYFYLIRVPLEKDLLEIAEAIHGAP